MKRLLLAVALACAFASSAWAQPAVNPVRFAYREIYNSTADDASTHTVGGTAYTTDSLSIFTPATPLPIGVRYIQIMAFADSGITTGTIASDSLQVRFLGTGTTSTQGTGTTTYFPMLQEGSLTSASLSVSPKLMGLYLTGTGGGTAQPFPIAMVRYKFTTGGTTAARIKNLRIGIATWAY